MPDQEEVVRIPNEQKDTGALSVLQGFKRKSAQDVVFDDNDGVEHKFTIKLFVGVKDYAVIAEKSLDRMEWMKKRGGKLAIEKVPAAMLEPFMEFFPDAVTTADNTYEFYLTDDAEIQTATTLQEGIVDPPMAWKEAAIMVRVNGMLTAALVSKINEFNTKIAIENAKND